jgi:hypothetical protein
MTGIGVQSSIPDQLRYSLVPTVLMLPEFRGYPWPAYDSDWEAAPFAQSTSEKCNIVRFNFKCECNFAFQVRKQFQNSNVSSTLLFETHIC